MEIVRKYAVAGGFIGIIPFSMPILLLLEMVMVYHLSVKRRERVRIGELGVIWGILLFVALFLKSIVGAIFIAFGPLGWIAKGLFAAGFILLFGFLVDSYFQAERKKSETT